MKFFVMFLIVCCAALSIIAIANTIRLNKLKQKNKRRIYHTPKLSSLHGKEFSSYIDYLTSGLH